MKSSSRIDLSDQQRVVLVSCHKIHLPKKLFNDLQGLMGRVAGFIADVKPAKEMWAQDSSVSVAC